MELQVINAALCSLEALDGKGNYYLIRERAGDMNKHFMMSGNKF